MKVYKCDQCGEEFDSKDGMIEGCYSHSRKIVLKEYYDEGGWAARTLRDSNYKVKKTIELYKTKPATSQLVPTEVTAKKDLCAKCVKLLEKP